MTKKFCYSNMNMQFGDRMLEPALESKLNYDLTSKSAFSNGNETFTSRSFSALLAKNEVPLSHKNVADNYLIIKKVFKFNLALGRISNVEKSLLEKYEFNTLENTTAEKIYFELAQMQKWSLSDDEELRTDSDEILQIKGS